MAAVTDRERVRLIRDRVIEARETWRLHRKMCRTCAQLTKDRSQYCDDGWDLRVELHHAERANRNLRQVTLVRQDPLF